jgi:hypothetical protein
MNPDEKADDIVSRWISENRYYFDGRLHPKARESLVKMISSALTEAKPKKAKEKA